MSKNHSFLAVFSIISLTALAGVSGPARGQAVSQPTILQWFEADWQTMERRTADLFSAGYGGVWTPPPGRGIYTTGGNGLGYDVYDRFDLGSPGDETLYGTEQGYRSAVSSIQRSGAKVYADYLINHASSFDWTDPDTNGVLFTDNPFSPGQAHGGGNPGFSHTFSNDFEGDFHPTPPVAPSGTAEFEYQFQLALLWDIDHRKNNSFIRQPVDPANGNNLPNAGTDPYLLPEYDRDTFTFRADPTPRLANVPTEKNRRFYPDQTDFDVVGDHVPGNPTSGLTSVTLQNFSGNEAASGIPVVENPMAYLMRHARWMVQDIGVDGFRVDAARHVYPFVHDFYDRGVWLADQRTHLDGSPRHVFSFLEAFTGDKNQLDIWAEKDLTNPLDTSVVRSNRDVLDLPLFFAMHDNLTANTANNNWHNIRSASFDVHDDNLLHDGSDGVMFVSSHDEEGAHLSNVAHAYMLMHPGEAIVYHNARGFNQDKTVDERPFPKDGRGDALGGLYGDTITDLVNLRNTHGRGDFIERYIDEAFGDDNGDGQQFSNLYVYEREGSALVALNSRVGGFGDWDPADNVQTSFAPGEILVELTGNSLNPLIDSNEGNVFEIPEVLVVAADGTVDLRIPQNHPDGGVEHNSGYVIYGLATPDTTLTLNSTSGATLGGENPTAQTNDTALLTTIDVVTGDSFEVRLDTAAVTHTDGGQSFRDANADGDFAILRLDNGREINNANPNGTISGVDFDNPNDDVTYGFENFVTESDAGFFNGDGNGTFRQVIDATQLEEGEHYITTRAFRRRTDGGVPVYTEDRRVVYVDRLLPESDVLSFDPSNQFVQDESLTGLFDIAGGDERDIIVRSLDLTAETIHVFANDGAALSDASFIARAQLGEGLAEQLDRDVFRLTQAGVASGNHAFTVVTIEPTGTTNVQRFAGFSVDDGLGLGLADLNADGVIDATDLLDTAGAFEQVLYSQNAEFNPAADLNGDGLVDGQDLYTLDTALTAGGADAATFEAYDLLLERRGNVDQLGGTDADDIDALIAALGTGDWFADLDSSGTVDLADRDLLLSTAFDTIVGDANLDGFISQADLDAVLLNWGRTDAGWATGDTTGDGFVSQADLDTVLLNWGFDNAAPPASRLIPEPATAGLLLTFGMGMTARRRRAN